MNDKLIWMCWFQGMDDIAMPELNRECFKRWEEFNPDYQVNILTNDNISDYVPEFVDIINSSPQRSHAAQSDLLRILLLSKYGGTWVDGSVYPMKPLSDFRDDIVNDVGFFAYRTFYHPKQYCITSSWFLAVDDKEHYLINRWKDEFIKRFTKPGQWSSTHGAITLNYFTFHHSLAFIYSSDVKA